jgi:hypothetical protein
MLEKGITGNHNQTDDQTHDREYGSIHFGGDVSCDSYGEKDKGHDQKLDRFLVTTLEGAYLGQGGRCLGHP